MLSWIVLQTFGFETVGLSKKPHFWIIFLITKFQVSPPTAAFTYRVIRKYSAKHTLVLIHVHIEAKRSWTCEVCVKQTKIVLQTVLKLWLTPIYCFKNIDAFFTDGKIIKHLFVKSFQNNIIEIFLGLCKKNIGKEN